MPYTYVCVCVCVCAVRRTTSTTVARCYYLSAPTPLVVDFAMRAMDKSPSNSAKASTCLVCLTSPGSIISVVTLCAALFRHNLSSHAGCNFPRKELSYSVLGFSFVCRFWTYSLELSTPSLKSSSMQPENSGDS